MSRLGSLFRLCVYSNQRWFSSSINIQNYIINIQNYILA